VLATVTRTARRRDLLSPAWPPSFLPPTNERGISSLWQQAYAAIADVGGAVAATATITLCALPLVQPCWRRRGTSATLLQYLPPV